MSRLQVHSKKHSLISAVGIALLALAMQAATLHAADETAKAIAALRNISSDLRHINTLPASNQAKALNNITTTLAMLQPATTSSYSKNLHAQAQKSIQQLKRARQGSLSNNENIDILDHYVDDHLAMLYDQALRQAATTSAYAARIVSEWGPAIPARENEPSPVIIGKDAPPKPSDSMHPTEPNPSESREVSSSPQPTTKTKAQLRLEELRARKASAQASAAQPVAPAAEPTTSLPPTPPTPPTPPAAPLPPSFGAPEKPTPNKASQVINRPASSPQDLLESIHKGIPLRSVKERVIPAQSPTTQPVDQKTSIQDALKNAINARRRSTNEDVDDSAKNDDEEDDW